MKKQLLFRGLLLCMLCIITGITASATEYSAKEYSFKSSSLSDGLACNGTFSSSYYQMNAGQYATISASTLFGTESLSSAMTVNVACGTYGNWSGDKTITLEACLCDASGTALTSAEFTTGKLNSTQGTYRGEFIVAKPADVSNISYLKVIFKTLTTTTLGCARFAGIKLTYNTAELDDAKGNCAMSFTETEVTVNIGDEGSFEKPVLYISEGCTATYSSSNTDVATVNENSGDVTFKGVAGSTTITANFGGNEDYNPASASYILNVVDPNTPGAEDNPYTVASVIANNNKTANDVWVKGYIVGTVVNNIFTFSTTGAVDSNLILADDANCTDSSAAIPVALPSGTIRDALNLSTNETNLGKLVLVKGNLEKYFSKTGVKSTSAYKFVDTSSLENVTVGQGEAEYFDLTGRRVENPTAGIYIRRVGTTATKVLVK